MLKQWAVGRQIWNGEELIGNGVPIVILHGWGRDHREWTALAVHLQKLTGRSVYALDLPGFGGSSLPAVENIDEYAELLGKWARYLGIPKMSVVGHSLGGRVAIVLAAQRASLVEKLVLIDPAGVKPSSLKRGLLTWAARMMGWFPTYWRRRLGERLMDEDYRRSPTLRELYRVVVREDLRAFLPRIKSPTWVIWGERDRVLPLALLDVYRNLIAQVRPRVVWEAGHDPHLTHPRELARMVEEAWI